jgi:PAS domain S-box-containing protein
MFAPDASDLLYALLESSPDAIVLISPEHRVLAFNHVMQEMLLNTLGKELVLGADYRDFVVQANQDLYLEYFEQALAGAILVTQHQHNHPQVCWVESTFKPLYSQSQALFGVTLRIKNIDEYKRAELALEQMAETFEAIIENTTESIVLLDPQRQVLLFNHVAKARLKVGFNREIVVGDDFQKFIFAGKESTFYAAFDRALQGESSQFEVLAQDYQGHEMWFQSRVFPVFKRNGELLGVSLFALNINDRKYVEIALAESEEKFRKIVDSAPTPILIVDAHMQIVLANPEVEHVFGYHPEQLEGQHLHLLIPERFHAQHSHDEQTYLRHPRPYKMGINRLTPARTSCGDEIIVEISLNGFQIGQDAYILAIIQDVTQRVKDQQQIAEQLERLKAIAWQQSHEVRKPVANILGLVHVLQGLSPSVEQVLCLNQLAQATDELDQIIRQIVARTYPDSLK